MAVTKSWLLETKEGHWTTKISNAEEGFILYVMDSRPVTRGITTATGSYKVLQVKIGSLDEVETLTTALRTVLDEARKMSAE